MHFVKQLVGDDDSVPGAPRARLSTWPLLDRRPLLAVVYFSVCVWHVLPVLGRTLHYFANNKPPRSATGGASGTRVIDDLGALCSDVVLYFTFQERSWIMQFLTISSYAGVPTTLMARFKVVATFFTSAGSTTLHWGGRKDETRIALLIQIHTCRKTSMAGQGM